MFMRPNFRSSDAELIEKFHRVDGFSTLADLLELNERGLQRIFYDIKKSQGHYNKFSIRKKDGGERIILSPDHGLKSIQRRLAYVLSLVYLGRSSVHGFRKGESIVSNAKDHTNKNILLNLDLEDFFPTIHFGRVRGILQAQPYNLIKSGATIIAGFCCCGGKLPQGAPTSPIISNMICSHLDYELQKLARDNYGTYSRYADDITFSTNKKYFSENIVKFDGGVETIGNRLKEIIVKNGFLINSKKTRVKSRFSRQEVTGLIVNKFPNVKRSFIRNIRVMLYMWEKFGLATSSEWYGSSYGVDFYTSLRGKIVFTGFIKSKQSTVYTSLARKFNTLSKKKIFEIVEIKDWPEEEFIGAGEIYKARAFLKKIFSLAENSIFIFDNYLKPDILSLLEERVVQNDGLSINILVLKNNNREYGDFIEGLRLFKSNHPTIAINCRKIIDARVIKLHGRFIVVDNEEVYRSGHSLMQLGEKSDGINRINCHSRDHAREVLMEVFSRANPVHL